jgi:hypothetical protein
MVFDWNKRVNFSSSLSSCGCECVRACVHAWCVCARACVRVCVCVCKIALPVHVCTCMS